MNRSDQAAPWLQRLAEWLGWLRQSRWRLSIAMATSGAAIAIVALVLHGVLKIPPTAAETLFAVFHPAHVFVCAATLARVFDRQARIVRWKAAALSYVLTIALVTTADSLLPFLAELLLLLPSRHLHYGFVELWWLINPLAVAGILLAFRLPRLRFPPLVVLLASVLPPLYDMMMAMWRPLDPVAIVTVAVFAALSVSAYLVGAATAAAAVVRGFRAGSPLGPAVDRCLAAVLGLD